MVNEPLLQEFEFYSPMERTYARFHSVLDQMDFSPFWVTVTLQNVHFAFPP